MRRPPQSTAFEDGRLRDALLLLDRLQPALRARHRASTIDIVRQVVALGAPLGQQWQALADLALQHGELALARQAMDRFVDADQGSPAALYRKALLLEQCGDVAAAHALLCELPEDVPDAAANAYSRGTLALFLGDMGEARTQLERATRLRPEAGVPWLMLATSLDMAEEPDLAGRLLSAERRVAGMPPAVRAPYYHAAGKVHADRGEPALAFAAFARAAADMRTLAPYSPEADRRNAEEAVRGHGPGGVGILSSPHPASSRETIFVTGLPRSGTTLVEQILVSHSEVSDGAELNRLLLLSQEIGGHSGEAVSAYVKAGGAADAARLWRHWMDERFPRPGIVVDKSLTSTRLLGVAAALLPEARLVWVTREPLDCAWSCFRTFLSGYMPWSHDLEDMAHHFRVEDELLARWQETLGERLLVVPYESLASEPGTWIPKLLAHCGLAVEEGVFAPHETGRVVTTSSALQVRRPISNAAIGSAEPYREFLGPFIESYSS